MVPEQTSEGIQKELSSVDIHDCNDLKQWFVIPVLRTQRSVVFLLHQVVNHINLMSRVCISHWLDL